MQEHGSLAEFNERSCATQLWLARPAGQSEYHGISGSKLRATLVQPAAAPSWDIAEGERAPSSGRLP